MTHVNTQPLQQLQQIIIKLLLPAQQSHIENVNLDPSYVFLGLSVMKKLLIELLTGK